MNSMLRVSDNNYFQKEIANLQSCTPDGNYPHTNFELKFEPMHTCESVICNSSIF